MKTFKVYKHPIRGFEAVKIGFSWPAFSLGIFWMMAKKLWAYAGIWFGLIIALKLIEAITDTTDAAGAAQAMGYLILAAAYFALWLVPAFKGNQWRVDNMTRGGYALIRTVTAETPDAATALVAGNQD